MINRVTLFLATNLSVIATISLISILFGFNSYLSAHGLDFHTLAVLCVLWGAGIAFLSLIFYKTIARFAMKVVIIKPNNATREEQAIMLMVARLAKKAGLKRVPRIGIYRSIEVNAFAVGRSKHHALIALSSGLLTNMNRDEIEAVLAHEVAHIANGDMVTLTLMQGVINAFSLFLSRLIAYLLSIAFYRNKKSAEFSLITYSIFTFIFAILFTLFGSLLVSSYSRTREYRADRAGARLVGRQRMIAALRRLQTKIHLEDDRAPSFAAFKMVHHPSWLEIFSSHPPLDKRIARLKKARELTKD